MIFVFVNTTRIYQFRPKDSEIKPYPICLGNISKDFTPGNMKKKGITGDVKPFPIDYDPINTSHIIDIPKFIMKEI